MCSTPAASSFDHYIAIDPVLVIPLDLCTVNWGTCPQLPFVFTMVSDPDPTIPLPASITLDTVTPQITVLESDSTLHGIYNLKLTLSVGTSS